jgi:hypothetical protein
MQHGMKYVLVYEIEIYITYVPEAVHFDISVHPRDPKMGFWLRKSFDWY